MDEAQNNYRVEDASKKCVMDDPIYMTRKCKKVYNERKIMNGCLWGMAGPAKGERDEL